MKESELVSDESFWMPSNMADISGVDRIWAMNSFSSGFLSVEKKGEEKSWLMALSFHTNFTDINQFNGDKGVTLIISI